MTDYQIDANRTNRHRFRFWLPVIAALLLAGCVRWQQAIEQHDLQQRVVDSGLFNHRLIWNNAAQQRLTQPAATTGLWHIYIEGDGHAVTLTGAPARDPTPLGSVLLPALGADRAPALFLGRPCYFDTADSRCDARHWTLLRYSDSVVQSLGAALQNQIPPGDQVILIGHSGGGTLATLLAARLPQTCAVITLAGNLAVGRWLAANDFTPLPDSLDPAMQPPLPARISQWHLAGADDTVILPAWIEEFARQQPNAHYRLVPGAGHLKPWQAMLINSLRAHPAPSPLQEALDNSQSECGKVTG